MSGFDTKLDTSSLSDLGRAAVWYCENGFAIIPIKEHGKAPATIHGLNDWFDDPKSAHELWTRSPNLNIAIVCGSPSHGLLVFDYDVDEESGKDGTATLGDWEDSYGELPPTCVDITGTGGMHYLYRTSRTNIHPSTNTELGVDVRCDGGYIIVPPSIHPNGRRYEWNDGDAPWERDITTANGAVYDFLDHVQRNGGQDETKKTNGKFKLPDKIKKGERDKTLFRYASHLRAIGRSDEEIFNSVMGANFTRCTPPMDSKEIQRIVKSACRYERGEDSSDLPNVGKPGTSDTTPDDFPPFRKVKSDGTLGAIQHNLLAQGIMSYDHARRVDGSLAVWTGKKWEFGVNAIKMMCTRHADDIKETTRTEVVKYINTSERLLSVSSENGFDRCYYVQFKNGTWDVLAQQFVEPNHQMYIVGTLPVELDLDAPYGDADRFLESVSDGDEYVERVLREIIGACMCNRKVIDQALMLIGRANGTTAANGKSTYIKVLKNVVGADNFSTLDIAMFGKPFFVADLVGKLANLGDDIPAGYLSGDGASVWKRAVTGETIKADVKYGDTFDFNPCAVQVFSMNVIPRLSADDDGLYRRLAFIPFRRHFEPGVEGYDKDIISKLTTTESLQRFAVLGLMELPSLIMRGKLTDIPDMVSELEDVRTNNDSVRRWIRLCGIEIPDIDQRWTRDVYAEFRKYAEDANENKLSQSTFTKRILAVWPSVSTYETRDRTVKMRGQKFTVANK